MFMTEKSNVRLSVRPCRSQAKSTAQLQHVPAVMIKRTVVIQARRIVRIFCLFLLGLQSYYGHFFPFWVVFDMGFSCDHTISSDRPRSTSYRVIRYIAKICTRIRFTDIYFFHDVRRQGSGVDTPSQAEDVIMGELIILELLFSRPLA